MPLPNDLTIQQRSDALGRIVANFDMMRIAPFFSTNPPAIVWLQIENADGWAQVSALRGLIRELQGTVAELEARLGGQANPSPLVDRQLQPAPATALAPAGGSVPGLDPETYERFLQFQAFQAGGGAPVPHKLVPSAPGDGRGGPGDGDPIVPAMAGYAPPPGMKAPEPVAPRIPSSRS